MRHRPSLMVLLLIAGALCLALSTTAHAAKTTYPEVVFILDASGSMWGKAGGQTKIEAAKEVMAKAVPGLPAEVKVGLVAYGHRRKGDCTDVEVLVPAGSTDRDGLLKKVAALSPKGKTPIADSIKQTAESLKSKENETTIILVSDGIETCNDDPCGVVKALKASGIKFVMHVVGFDVDSKGKAQLECLAQAAGGKYFSAGDAASLLAALDSVKKEVVVKVEKAKTTKTKAKTRLGKLKITMPKEAVISLANISIIRVKDNKLLKEAKPAASGVHPLLAGKYKLILAFANTNYQKPTNAPLGEVEIKGGETTEVTLGAVVINIPKELIHGLVAAGLTDEGSEKDFVTIQAGNNDYYMLKPKPCPAGTYTLVFTIGRSKFASPVVSGIKVEEGKATTVTIDSGIALKPAKGVTSWQVTKNGSETVVLKVSRRWDNDWPLWKAFPLMPGSYDVYVMQKGMTEPLPVGEGIEVQKGQTVVFDTGM